MSVLKKVKICAMALPTAEPPVINLCKSHDAKHKVLPKKLWAMKKYRKEADVKKRLWWNWIIICILTLSMVIPAVGSAQAQQAITSISFSGGTRKSLLTYGLHAALSQAGRINLDSSGRFSVSVPFSATTAPTKSPPPFSVEVSDLRMQGDWNDQDAQGTFTLTSTIISKRVDRSDLADPMGNDEWYYLTTYNYVDVVTASGTITRDANNLVFTMDAVVNRTGNTRLVNVIVNDGQTTTGNNPTITDKSGTFSETARYSFIISEAEVSKPRSTDTPTPKPTLTPTLEPTETPSPTETATPPPTATTSSCKPLSEDDKLKEILSLYYAQIPKGITDSGNKNNLYTIWDDKYKEFACGGYQGKVLQLLSNIKFNSDPCVSAWLDDWDYGPIEAIWGGHQAVVIYPHGTTWTDTGLVLDPWITQSPKVYTIQNWAFEFALGTRNGIRGSSVYDENREYPTAGGDYVPPGGVKLSPEENDYMRNLPLEKQERLKKMAPVDRKTWLMQAVRKQIQNTTLSVNSPLDVYMTDDEGHFTGFVNGNFMGDLPDVSFRRFLRADGHYWTEVEYPAGRNYRVVMYGTGDGQARVFSTVGESGATGVAYQYDFSVSTGEFYQSETGEIGTSFIHAQSRIEPNVALTADLAWIDSQPGLVEPERYKDATPRLPFSSTWIFFGAIPGLFCFGTSFVILLAGFFAKNKKISLLGLVLIAIVICITLAAFVIYGGSQLLASTP